MFDDNEPEHEGADSVGNVSGYDSDGIDVFCSDGHLNVEAQEGSSVVLELVAPLDLLL